MNFVEENCASFENKEENKLEYTDIHNRYKALVETLLGEYLRELSITEEEFSKACNQGKSAFENLEGMFEYIWAADDFLLFKGIMATHNLEIEMQAISMSQGNDVDIFGDFPPMNPKYANPEKGDFYYPDEKKEPIPTTSGGMHHVLSQSKEEYQAVVEHQNLIHEKEESDLQRAIQFSKQEMERLNAQAAEEKRMLDEAIQLSLEAMRETSSNGTHSHPSTSSIPLRQEPLPTVLLVSSAAQNSSEQHSPKKLKKTKTVVNAKDPSLPPLQKPQGSSDAALDWIANAQKESMSTTATNPISPKRDIPEHLLNKAPGIDPEELAKRKAYLQSQREKLLEAKRKKREGELKEYQNGSSSQTSSASSKSSTAENFEEKEKMLKARRALADRLKREVIQKET
uniref:Cilia- and flagella-associated protein 36 n=1 Tax=Phallusia mammillata TaxID=59560 RepID=A0A6F9D983_9ASCI|nr:coiled-coil domain-containing protein 104 [Phallusia mammillata]